MSVVASSSESHQQLSEHSAGEANETRSTSRGLLFNAEGGGGSLHTKVREIVGGSKNTGFHKSTLRRADPRAAVILPRSYLTHKVEGGAQSVSSRGGRVRYVRVGKDFGLLLSTACYQRSSLTSLRLRLPANCGSTRYKYLVYI